MAGGYNEGGGNKGGWGSWVRAGLEPASFPRPPTNGGRSRGRGATGRPAGGGRGGARGGARDGEAGGACGRVSRAGRSQVP